MTKFSTIAFSSLLFMLVCSNIALAQSTGAAPATKAPSAAQLAIQNAIEIKTVELNQTKHNFDFMAARQANAARELQTLESNASKLGISSESFPEIVKNLQAKRIDLLIDVAGLERKRDMILEWKKAKTDDVAIVEPLEKIIAIKEAKLKEAQKLASSSESAEEIRSAETSLLSSKVQLASIKSEKDSSNLLSNTLLDTSLALAESKARLAKTESLLGKVLPARTELESCLLLREQSFRLFKDKEAMITRMTSLKQELEDLQTELKQLKNDEY